jgi:hypothetical protein
MVYGLGLKKSDVGLRVEDLRFRVEDSRFRVGIKGLWFRFQDLGLRFQNLGFKVEGLGFRVWCPRCGIESSRFMVQHIFKWSISTQFRVWGLPRPEIAWWP